MSDGGGFGERLGVLRLLAGLSQEELAARSGLSIRAVGNLERGRTRWPYPESVHRLADALGLRGDQRVEFVTAAGRRLARTADTALTLVAAHLGAAGGVGGGVRFSVLGPLQVADSAGAPRVIPAAKQRIVLAALLLSGGRMVSPAALAEALWDVSPPPNAPAVIRTYVARLRRALGPAGARIAAQPPGWAVELHGPQEFDLAEVDWLWHDARTAGEAGDWQRVSALLGRALSLWRGEALADVPSAALARQESGRLTELRLQLTESRIDANLRLGRHSELVAELRRLAAEHPLREHFRAQLMLACYRCGHQAAALEVYREAHRILAEELGVEPGHELRDMHQKILTADPGLTVPASVTVTAASQNRESLQPRGLGVAVPRQLPAAVPHFTGRAAELALLTRLAGQVRAAGPGAVLIISGMAGVGKTALAVHWARQAADLFPDGQLYVNLLGFSPFGQPADPAAVIRGLLEALGVPGGRIPASPQAQAGLYRSLVADKRMLVVLDNARDAAHVRPLLPGAPGCLVLATSRSQLTGLSATDGAQILLLGVLADAEARELLAGRLGTGRTGAESEAVNELVRSCAGLPLALAITAARAAACPHHPLAALAAELRDVSGRLDALDEEDAAGSVRTVFSWSHSQLRPGAARMFGLLGLHPGPDITAAAAASLAGITVTQAGRQLGELTRCHLLAEPVPSRYTIHDLLRAYAVEQAHAEHSDTDRYDAVIRVLDYYLHTAAAADRLLYPLRRRITLPAPRPGVTPDHLSSSGHALAWLDAEHRNLTAAVSLAARDGYDAHTWQLAFSLETFFYRRCHWQDWAATQRAALAAARRLGDRDAQALAHSGIANALIEAGHPAEAFSDLAIALRLREEAGDVPGQARVHLYVTAALERLGRYDEALARARIALRLARAAGQPQSLHVDALNQVGWFLAKLGRYRRALCYCQQAVALGQHLGHSHAHPPMLDSLAYVYQHLGRNAEAAACYRRAVELCDELGYRYWKAETLMHLGDGYRADANMAAARQAWTQALAILDELHHPDAATMRAKLTQTIPNTSAKAAFGGLSS